MAALGPARELCLGKRYWCLAARGRFLTARAPRPRRPALCQVLDHYFGNVCELDLVFGFHKVYCLLDEFIVGGEIQETSKKARPGGGAGARGTGAWLGGRGGMWGILRGPCRGAAYLRQPARLVCRSSWNG